MNKKTNLEIHTIANSHNRRPYASKIAIVLPKGLEYGFDGETSLLLEEPYIVRIKPNSPQNFIAFIEGFATAGEAEKMGLKLSLALLWSAISRKWPLKIDYHTPQPCMVFDRTQNQGGGFGFSASMTVRSGASQVANLIEQVLSKPLEFNPRLLISMELFTSARLETTERAKFIGLVSSLEPLATSDSYMNEELNCLITNLTAEVEKLDSLSDKMKLSIKSRANALKAESISQAMTRFVSRFFDQNSEAIEIVKDAYNLRSKILHEGIFDADLDEKGNKLEDVIRHIYSQLLDIELLFPAVLGEKV